jgi:hypothetical protein
MDLREVIGIAIGEASMCWSELPKGVFDSIKASALVDRILLACDQALREAVEEERFIPGQFRCAKCGFFLISKTIYMKSGTIGANNKPTECSNGCGPMWRVSWQEGYKTALDRLEKANARSAGERDKQDG